MTQWRKFWQKEGKKEYDKQYRKIHLSIMKDVEKVIKKYNYQTILDFGCGPAIIIKELAKKYPTKKYFGYDLSNYIIKKNKKTKKRNLSFKNENLTKIPKNQKFDLILSFSTLHYFKYPLKKIKKLMKIVKNDGSLIINYPNKKLLNHIIKKEKNLEYWKERWKYMFQHKNLIKLSDIKKLGFEYIIIRKKKPYNLYVQIIKK